MKSEYLVNTDPSRSHTSLFPQVRSLRARIRRWMTIQTNILDTVLVKPISLYLSENIYLSL